MTSTLFSNEGKYTKKKEQNIIINLIIRKKNNTLYSTK